jgi:hypothetical protein
MGSEPTRDPVARITALASTVETAPAASFTSIRVGPLKDPVPLMVVTLCFFSRNSVPAKLFWSITVYDAKTRSQIQTDQNKAALRSLFELADLDTSQAADLHFAPEAPADDDAKHRWIKTIPGKGWFVYFRIYGPDEPAFDGSWQLPDFEAIT